MFNPSNNLESEVDQDAQITNLLRILKETYEKENNSNQNELIDSLLAKSDEVLRSNDPEIKHAFIDSILDVMRDTLQDSK